MFKFNLSATVKIGNHEGGAEVIARAEYQDRPNQYLCKYYNESGLPVHEWFDEKDLS